MIIYYVRNIINTDMSIKNSLWFDDGDRTLLTESMAAREIDYDVADAFLGECFFSCFPDFDCLA